MLDCEEKRHRWIQYINKAMSSPILNEALSLIDKTNVITGVVSIVGTLVELVSYQSLSWWRESAKMILQGKITGVKMEIEPNETGSYPVCYKRLYRY